MMKLAGIALFIAVFLLADSLGPDAVTAQAEMGQKLGRHNTLTLISENTPRFSSQSFSRIRTTIRGADGKSVPVEVSVRLQSQGGDEAFLTLVRDGAPGDLILALPDTTLGPEDIHALIIQDGGESEMHYTTIGALRAGKHGHGLSLQHQEIDDSTPALLLRRAGRDRLEARLRLRDTVRIGRILVTLGGTSGWTSV
ncbi:hypothetical protein [Fodinicurvata fenggangensis]|uniref:hypothetical protein n=1 Tax=Fodinicurvata fenggangensis TaxID=1121830 RepID=UPI00047955ED|nr:hypothetical protein [Fodinicurvata fenggangensis]